MIKLRILTWGESTGSFKWTECGLKCPYEGKWKARVDGRTVVKEAKVGMTQSLAGGQELKTVGSF